MKVKNNTDTSPKPKLRRKLYRPIASANNANATAAAVRILYEDGSEIGRVGAQNRIPVTIDQVPDHVQRAVLAAEDRGFYR